MKIALRANLEQVQSNSNRNLERVHSDSNRLDREKRKQLLEQHGEGLAAIASGIMMVAAWGMEHISMTVSAVLYMLSFAVGGFAKAKEGLTTLVKEKDLDVNLLMILAAIGAAGIGHWAEGAMLIFIFSLSGALESYTMNKSRRDISALISLKPEHAVLYENGNETVVPIGRLKAGDVVLVRPGERIPADGIIRSGTSAVDQSTITGEPVPVDKTAGDEVFAGTLNGQGSLFIEVTQASESTLFAKIIQLVQEAQSEKPVSQRFVEKLERLYARAVVVATVLIILIPPLGLDMSWEASLYKAMVFLVVASPCALVASIMPAMLSAISKSARKGLLFKGGAHLENLSRTRIVAFDKTGTLTEGRPVLNDLIPYQGYTEEQLLHIVASIESLSEHPLAKAIVEKAKDQGIVLDPPDELQARTGWGVQAKWGEDTWNIGKPAMLDKHDTDKETADTIERLQREGKTVVVAFNSRGIAGIIALKDRIRPQAKSAVERLQRMGIRVVMLTGDQQTTAQQIAGEAGIEHVHAELLPVDKVNRIKELRQKYDHVVMVGDGVNDAPALAAATVGAAMGGAGSDAALETADMVLMHDDLTKIAEAIQLGKKTQTIVKQNIAFSLSVIFLLIIANFTQGISLPLGVIGHEGSTILVILNGLRLLR